MFKFQGGIYQNALEDLTEELALKRPSNKSNHANWLLGHILHCRYMLANMIGAKAENPFDEVYCDAIENGDYPTVEKVFAQFPIISEKVLDRLSGLTDSELDAKPAHDKPALADIVSFFVYHEAYHIGQLGYVRKLIGLAPMKSH